MCGTMIPTASEMNSVTPSIKVQITDDNHKGLYLSEEWEWAMKMIRAEFGESPGRWKKRWWDLATSETSLAGIYGKEWNDYKSYLKLNPRYRVFKKRRLAKQCSMAYRNYVLACRREYIARLIGGLTTTTPLPDIYYDLKDVDI